MQSPSNINELLKSRKVNLAFVDGLETTDVRRYPMPGSLVTNPGIPHLKTKQSAEVVLAEHLATVRHKPSGRIFIIYQDTVEALYLDNLDPVKYPAWLLETKEKQSERFIHISEMMRPPADKYDRSWVGDIDESTFESIFYFSMPDAWRSR